MNQSDEMRRAIKLLEKLRDDLQEESNKFQTREGQFGNGYIGYENSAQKIHELIELLAARQAAESPGPVLNQPGYGEGCSWGDTEWRCILPSGHTSDHELRMRILPETVSQMPSAERSLAEVSADGVVEACAVIAERNHTTAFIPRDIRALKGTFSLRASGTPLVEVSKLPAKWRRAIEDSIVSGKSCDPESVADCADELECVLAAAPTLSEAGACPECHRSDRHEEGCPWDRPPSAKLSDSEKASWNEDLNAKKWDG